MPLSENPEEKVRQLLTDNWNPTNTENYDPTITNPTNQNFLPITTDWNTGDTYPIITVTNNNPTVPGGGETSITGLQGAGTGFNQRRLETMQVTIQASGDTSYNNNKTAHEMVQILSDEIERVISSNFDAANDTEVWNYFFSPPVHTVEKSDTSSFHQYALDVTLHWQFES